MTSGLKRWAGLTDADGDARFASQRLEPMQFLDALFDRTDKDAAVTVTDMEVTVPDNLLMDIPGGLVVYDDPTDSDNFQCWTAPGLSGTQYTPVADQFAALSAGQVRVRKGTGRLDFPEGDEGATLYLTFQCRMGGVPASLLARIWAELRQAQTFYLREFTAGQAWDNQAMYIAGDGKAYVSDPSNFSKQAWGFGVGSGTANQTVVLLRDGVITPGGSFPIGKALYVGQNGALTWKGDDSGSELVAGDWEKFAGVSFDGETVDIFLKQPVIRQYTEEA